MISSPASPPPATISPPQARGAERLLTMPPMVRHPLRDVTNFSAPTSATKKRKSDDQLPPILTAYEDSDDEGDSDTENDVDDILSKKARPGCSQESALNPFFGMDSSESYSDSDSSLPSNISDPEYQPTPSPAKVPLTKAEKKANRKSNAGKF